MQDLHKVPLQIVSGLLEMTKEGWNILQETVYQRSQEQYFNIADKSLSLSKKAKVAHFNAWWFDGLTSYMIKLMICGVLYSIFYCIVESGILAEIAQGTAKKDDVVNGMMMLCALFFIMLLPIMRVKWIRRSNLVTFINEIKNNEPVQYWLNSYTWVYATYKGLTFTDVRPSFLFRISDRFPTHYPWEKPYRRDPITWLSDALFSGLYLRILWPYFFNPMQLAFLEYDRAAKNIELKEGQRVLIIGSGAVPHHTRWKKRLGPDGMITALDIDPAVLKDSERIERMIEWMRGIFGKRRWISEHIAGDAAELPLETAKFDAIIAIRCYFVSVDEALRVLKPEGKLLISNCGDIAELPKHDDPRRKGTFTGWVITNTPRHNSALQQVAV